MHWPCSRSVVRMLGKSKARGVRMERNDLERAGGDRSARVSGRLSTEACPTGEGSCSGAQQGFEQRGVAWLTSLKVHLFVGGKVWLQTQLLQTSKSHPLFPKLPWPLSTLERKFFPGGSQLPWNSGLDWVAPG